MTMELLCLIAFLVIWTSYIKLQRFQKLQRINDGKHMKGELLTFNDSETGKLFLETLWPKETTVRTSRI